jgi:hypothetical protein
MKLKKIVSSLAAFGVAAALAGPAQAGYAVLDGWELDAGGTVTKNIGRLNLVSGSSSVVQQIDGSGNVFAGALFSETGLIYSISYTKENVIGAGDIGAPIGLPDTLTIAFSDILGHVTGPSGAGFSYVFDSGTFTMSGTGGLYATGSVVGIGGNFLGTKIIGGNNGDSTVLGKVLSMARGFDLKDSLGNSLATDLLAGNVLFEAVTNNNITGAGAVGACSFAPGTACATFNIADAGDGYLVRAVPEPEMLSLVGLAMLGLGISKRRRAA